ncbi:response regulator [Ruminococcaceae bacterium OttesenSCG-928-D13]|nr:response regulator [Ruminococcaceae bacterium OttesenSCG-928-D13]
MKKVLIVDDEPNICALISNLTNWDELGLSCVGKAYDGESALAQIENLRPDIVITDIQMPKMDGMTLLKHARERYGDTISFIIVSGFKQFDYAYEAIKYGVVDFLLKPINKEELNATLGRLVTGNDVDVATSFNITDEGSDRLIRKQLLADILFGSPDAAQQDSAAVADTYRYHFGSDFFVAGVLCIDEMESLGKMKSTVITEIERVFANSRGAVSHDMGGYISGKYIWFMMNLIEADTDALRTVLQHTLELMRRTARVYSFLTLTMAVSPIVGFGQLRAAFSRVKKTIDGRAILDTAQLLDSADYNEAAALAARSQLNEQTDQIKKAVDAFDLEGLLTQADAYISDVLLAGKSAPWLAVEWIGQRCRYIVLESLNQHAPSMIPEYIENGVFDFRQCGSEIAVRQKMGDVISTAYRRIEELKETQESKTIRKVKQYIAENYAKPITLEDVAAEVFLSSSYLGVLFKKETGELFSQYVTAYRMERAKDMLKDHDYSVKMIAERVGYKDIRNFSKLFKAHTGVKPTDYRKIYRLDSEN